MPKGSARAGRGGPPAILACLVLIACTCTSSDALRVGPQGRVRTICFGDVIDQYAGYNSFTIIQVDPAIDTTLIPSRPDYVGGIDNARRNMRIYMPRTYDRLVRDHDVILTSDADSSVFRSDWISWMADSVRKGGLGFLWLGSLRASNFEGWDGTTLIEISATDPAPGDYTLNGPFGVRITDREEPLMGALPWDRAPPLANLNSQVPKEGSVVWARVIDLRKSNLPLMTFWNVGEGVTLNFASKFPNGVMPWSKDWDLFPQAMMYLVYRVAEKDLPEDPMLFERVMNSFIMFDEADSLLQSLIEWVERFGGSTRKLHESLEELGETKRIAEGEYLSGEIQQAIETLERARAEQDSVRDSAMKAKDQALLWVYVIEWCSLVATSMVTGFVVWSLMVRRRLYREVGVSRLQSIYD